MRKVSAAEFVKEWQKAESVTAFAKKTGMSKLGASARATTYRQKGIKLKKFVRGGHGPRMDIAGLNKIAKATARK